jgi:hypothetical protein
MNSIDADDDMATIWQFPFTNRAKVMRGRVLLLAGINFYLFFWMRERELTFSRDINYVWKRFQKCSLRQLVASNHKKIICNHFGSFFCNCAFVLKSLFISSSPALERKRNFFLKKRIRQHSHNKTPWTNSSAKFFRTEKKAFNGVNFVSIASYG